jgi:transcriptional regulator with XRE-family HTH domain
MVFLESTSARMVNLRNEFGLSRPKFALLADVGLHTIARVENNQIPASDYLIEKLEKAIPGSRDYLAGITDEMPKIHYHKISDSPEQSDGNSLRMYLSRLGITQTELATRLEVSKAMVNNYLNTTNFRSDVREKILKALDVSDMVIFGGRQLSRITVKSETEKALYKEFVAVPFIGADNRDNLNLDRMLDILINFDTQNPEPGIWMMHRRDISDAELATCMVLETVQSDRLPFPSGSYVATSLVSASEYGTIQPEDYVAVRAASQIIMAQVKENRLEQDDEMLLALNGGFSMPLTVRSQDIEYIFLVMRLLESPL